MIFFTKRTTRRCRPTCLVKKILLLPAIFSLAILPYCLFAQISVSGVVTNTAGTALNGATVQIKGANTGTKTEENGSYLLEVPDTESVLVFSMVGFTSKEVKTGDRTRIDIALESADETLDDVVVIGFGKQKRTDMIGSVVSVKPSDLKVPSSNLTTALAGRVAGMIGFQRSGEPGADNADFFIRGVTTFGYKVDPLILIDNVEVTTTDLARLQVDDIASFSIMKDATATAVYGARGANGVILITTKQGAEGPASVSLRVENSVSAPTSQVELADPITYMRLHNEAVLTRDRLAQVPYSLEKIDQTLNGGNQMYFPATDWYRSLLKDYTMNQRVNLSVSGGGKVARYFVSTALNNDNGILKVPKLNSFNNNIDLKTYSLRGNIDISLTNTTRLGVRMNGSFDDYTGPLNGGTKVYRDIMRTNPVHFPAYYEPGDEFNYLRHIMFGNYAEGNYLNPYADMVKGYRNYSRSMMLAQLELQQDFSFLTKGLSFRMMANTTRNSFFEISRQYRPFFYQLVNDDGGRSLKVINENTGREYLDYSEGNRAVSSVFYMESALNYSNTFGDKHTLSGMLVSILRNRIDGNTGSLQQSLPYRNIGLSGRFTYAYDNRYFGEFNFGYNGSERFHRSKRFGFFPSAGVAWSVSNEAFWTNIKPVISNFRIRGTYGLVGNDAIGSADDRFYYLSEINMDATGRSASFGINRGYSRNGIVTTRYSNPDITWETSYKTNLALEIGLFNRLDIIADFFSEHRKNIFMQREYVPSQMGLAAGIAANVGEVKGKGMDISANYTHSFANQMWLQATANFTFARSAYEVFEEPDYSAYPWLSRIGKPISGQMGYWAERLFIDDAEVDHSPEQSFGEVSGGDIKYRDINGDGRITSLDRQFIGYPTIPEINYGFGFSLGIKDFDVSVFLQGLARESFWINTGATAPFLSYIYSGETFPVGTVLQNQLLAAYADSHWSEENQDLYAMWPRLSPINVVNNEQTSTWFMRDGTFLRLKQAELGYSLPARLMSRWKIDKARLYLNGTNLLLWSKFKTWDVEMAGNGLGYPLQRVFNIGFQLSF